MYTTIYSDEYKCSSVVLIKPFTLKKIITKWVTEYTCKPTEELHYV